MVRSGVTPVLAVIMLTILTISVAGGAAVWFTDLLETTKDDTSRDISTDLQIKSLTCNSSGATAYLKNQGGTEIGSGATIYLYKDDDLTDDLRKDMAGKDFLQPGGFDNVAADFSTTLSSGELYTVEISFSDGTTVQRGCRPPLDTGTVYGEAGTVDVSGDVWSTAFFDYSYDNPIVVATTNTKNTGNDPLIPQVKNVQSDSAQVRLCDHDDSDGCDTGLGTETAGYLALDAAEANSLSGVEAGTTTVSGGFGSEYVKTTNFGSSFSNAPIVFVTGRTQNGNEEWSVWTTDTTTSGFDVQLCDHDESSTDDCETHSADETFNWIAIDPANIPSELSDMEADVPGSQAPGGDGDSSWQTVSFSTDFTNTPVGIAMIQENNGGQDPKITEIRNIDAGADQMDIRFCEHDTGEDCDSHMDNYVGWLVVPEMTFD